MTIKVGPVRDGLFSVTWQESDKATIVHLEDYKNNTIVTHITSPNMSFDIFHGTMSQIS